jgi:hypothetical protein
VRALIVAGVIGLLAATAAGQDAKSQAKAAFERAVAAEHKKDWRTAIEEFQSAYDLSPHADVLYNIAVDFERLEEFRDAATYYRRYLDEMDDAPDRAKVEKLIRKLRERPGEVTITSDPSGAEVAIDGRVVGKTPWTGPLTGAHQVAITGPGGTRDEDLVVEYGEPKQLDVTLAAKTGMLSVQSNVAGAQITVDGTYVGVTPLDVPLTAGPHRVLVASPGWASYERPIEVPSEGSTQMTANLVRPLGFVEPAPPQKLANYYLAIAGGADASANVGALGQFTFGAERGLFAAGLGYGYVQGATSFALEARVAFTQTKIRPYVRATALLGAYSALTASAGVMVKFPAGTKARMSLLVDVGIGRVRTDTAESADDHAIIIPVVAGIQISY